MSTILTAAACFYVLSRTMQASDDDCVQPSVQDVLPGKAHEYIRSVVAPSMYDCAAECKLSPPCLFFTFDLEKRACQLLKARNSSFAVGSDIFFNSIQEWKMPLTGPCRNAACGPKSRCTVGRNGHPLCSDDALYGMECTSDDDCHATMMLCFLGRCLCHPGYIHNIRSNSCDRDCQMYGDTMTPYKGLAIKGHNNKYVTNVDTIEMCMSACVEETSFLCKTIDFKAKPPKCHLSSEGYLDVAAKERKKDLDEWYLAVRKCQE